MTRIIQLLTFLKKTHNISQKNNITAMNKNKLIVFLLSFIFISFKANALPLIPIGGYFGVRGSEYLGTHNDNNNGHSLGINNSSFSPSINAGIKLFDFRFELEYMYRFDGIEIKDSLINKKYNTQIKMLNIYYDIMDLFLVKLYANVGFGKYDAKTSLVNEYNDKVWNIGLGTTFSLVDVVNVDVGIRHFDMGKMKYNNQTSKQSFEELYAGLRFGF